jgi:hypothetical protein
MAPAIARPVSRECGKFMGPFFFSLRWTSQCRVPNSVFFAGNGRASSELAGLEACAVRLSLVLLDPIGGDGARERINPGRKEKSGAVSHSLEGCFCGLQGNVGTVKATAGPLALPWQLPCCPASQQPAGRRGSPRAIHPSMRAAFSNAKSRAYCSVHHPTLRTGSYLRQRLTAEHVQVLFAGASRFLFCRCTLT